MKKIVLLLIVFPLITLYSQDIDYTTLSEKEIVKIIDESLENRDKNIDPIFKNLDVADPNYKRFEAYVLDYVKEVVDSDDLDYPLYLVESVLYNNLENEDAQDLYNIIINRQIEIKDRKANEVVKEEEKKEELEKVAKEVEEKYTIEEELQNRFEETSTILDSIPREHSRNDYTRFINHTFFYPFSMNIYDSEVYDEFSNRDKKVHTARGYAFTATAEAKKGIFSIRSDASLNGIYTDRSSEAASSFTGDLLISGGYHGFYVPIYLTTGFFYNYFHYEDLDDSKMAIRTLPSPVIGVAVLDFKFLKILQVDIGFYPMIAPLYTDNLNSGFLFKSYLTLNNIRFSKYSLEFRGGVDWVYLNEGGLMENYVQPKVGIGISIYE